MLIASYRLISFITFIIDFFLSSAQPVLSFLLVERKDERKMMNEKEILGGRSPINIWAHRYDPTLRLSADAL